MCASYDAWHSCISNSNTDTSQARFHYCLWLLGTPVEDGKKPAGPAGPQGATGTIGATGPTGATRPAPTAKHSDTAGRPNGAAKPSSKGDELYTDYACSADWSLWLSLHLAWNNGQAASFQV